MKTFLAPTLTVLLLSAATAALAQPAQDANDASRGKQLFMSYNCYLCHGTVGQGGAGPTIAPPDLPDRAAFMAFVRRPSPANMPPFTTKVLADADLSSIWSYLHSLPAPASTLPADLSRLRSASTK